MPGIRLAELVRRLRRGVPDGSGSSDAELLARFTRHRDEAAFELLVWRHGAMVLAACRRVLGQTEDAEDAFQATFLVLAKKAGAVTRGAALPAWLHQVAVRIAGRAAKSRKPALALDAEPAALQRTTPERVEQLGVLDEEIARLPGWLRPAVVLHYLEGHTAAEVARQLGCPTGTVESRLAAARKRLRDRLTRRGVTLPAGVLATLATHGVLAPEAVARLARAAGAFVRGGATAAAAITGERSVRLAKGAMTMGSGRGWAAAVLTAATVTAGVVWANRPAEVAVDERIAGDDLPVAPQPTAKGEKPADQLAPAGAWPLAKEMRLNFGALAGISPDSRWLLFHDQNPARFLGFDFAPKRVIEFVPANTVLAVAISPDGKYLATAEGANGVKLRDLPTGKVVEALWPKEGLPASQVAFTPDGAKLVAVCSRATGFGLGGKGGLPGDPNEKSEMSTQICIWDVATRKEASHPVESLPMVQGTPLALAGGGFGPSQTLLRPSHLLTADGRFVLKMEPIVRDAEAKDRSLYPIQTGNRYTLIDTATGAAGKSFELTGRDSFRTLPDPLSPDGKTLAVMASTRAMEVRLIDTATGKERVKPGPMRRPIHAVTFSPDGKYVAAATGERRGNPKAGGKGGFGPDDGDTSIAGPSEVVIWDAATGKEVARHSDKESIRQYQTIRFSPDSSYLVAQDAGGTLVVLGRPPVPEPAKTGPKPPATAEIPDRFEALVKELAAPEVTDQRRVECVFLATLGRLPTDVENRTLMAPLAKRTDKAEAVKDLLFILVQTAEFKAHAEALGRLAK